MKINIKPLSVNRAYIGRKVMTKEHRAYRTRLLLMLPNMVLPPPPFRIYYEWGVSNMASDVDNPVKPFQDALQKKYNFNDSKVHEIIARKVKVPKGQEYIKFKILTTTK